MKTRITIIEDNIRIREGFVQLIVYSTNYEVAGCYGNFEDAIKNIDRDKAQVILMDIDLPGINGIEGTSKIKILYPDCIIIIITIMEDSDKVFRSLCAGANGYLVKNSDVNNIIRSLDEALAGGAPMSLHIAKMVVQSFAIRNDSPLSFREIQVLQSVAQGNSYSKIAIEFFISKETVRSHIKNIYQKLAVNSKSAALKLAATNNWISVKW